MGSSYTKNMEYGQYTAVQQNKKVSILAFADLWINPNNDSVFQLISSESNSTCDRTANCIANYIATVSPSGTPKTCNVGAYLIPLHDFDLAKGTYRFHRHGKDFIASISYIVVNIIIVAAAVIAG